MGSDKIQEDIARAQRISGELQSGKRQAILELYTSYHLFFLNFTSGRLYDPQRVEGLLSQFWIEIMDGTAIFRYKGRNGASLRTFLLAILRHHIIEENRRIRKERNREGSLAEDSWTSNSTPLDSIVKSETEALSGTLVHEALLLLSQLSPRDSKLIEMNFFEGLNYDQMAERELNEKKIDEEKLKRRPEAIKAQIYRKRTGSKAKFKGILERLMKAKGIKYEDI